MEEKPQQKNSIEIYWLSCTLGLDINKQLFEKRNGRSWNASF